jgi:hypothetical protein
MIEQVNISTGDHDILEKIHESILIDILTRQIKNAGTFLPLPE